MHPYGHKDLHNYKMFPRFTSKTNNINGFDIQPLEIFPVEEKFTLPCQNVLYKYKLKKETSCDEIFWHKIYVAVTCSRN